MKVEAQDLAACVKKLAVEVSAEEVAAAFDRAYAAISKRVKIKGFRPGKAPRRILRQYYRSDVESEVLQWLIPEAYGKAIAEQGLKVVGEPKVEDVDLHADAPFTFTATVEILPEVEVGDYRGLSFTRSVQEVGEEEVNRQLEAWRERQAELEAVSDRGVEAHDFVRLDYTLSLDGAAVEDGGATDYTALLGRGRLLPDFERTVLGMRPGETRQFDLSFPPDYQNDKLAGKTALCQVTLKELKKATLPELDDTFAQSLGAYESLEHLRGQLLESLQQTARETSERQLRRTILEALLERNLFEVPEALVEEHTSQMLAEYQRRLRASGLSSSQVHQEVAPLREQLRPEARHRAKASLLLQAVARQEGLEVDDETLDAEVRTLAEQTNKHLGTLKSSMRENGTYDLLRMQLLEEKAYQAILSSVSVAEEVVPAERGGASEELIPK
ncbi:MAG: trigger factor [Candidatus Tectomicrobia bacterium]|nr:trigger factor [Candidatus Tectomicrobia bacterium]